MASRCVALHWISAVQLMSTHVAEQRSPSAVERAVQEQRQVALKPEPSSTGGVGSSVFIVDAKRYCGHLKTTASEGARHVQALMHRVSSLLRGARANAIARHFQTHEFPAAPDQTATLAISRRTSFLPLRRTSAPFRAWRSSYRCRRGPDPRLPDPSGVSWSGGHTRPWITSARTSAMDDRHPPPCSRAARWEHGRACRRGARPGGVIYLGPSLPQVAEQPSPDRRLPSSQSSTDWRVPSPQRGASWQEAVQPP
jgi:hypothetical protein